MHERKLIGIVLVSVVLAAQSRSVLAQDERFSRDIADPVYSPRQRTCI